MAVLLEFRRWTSIGRHLDVPVRLKVKTGRLKLRRFFENLVQLKVCTHRVAVNKKFFVTNKKDSFRLSVVLEHQAKFAFLHIVLIPRIFNAFREFLITE